MSIHPDFTERSFLLRLENGGNVNHINLRSIASVRDIVECNLFLGNKIEITAL